MRRKRVRKWAKWACTLAAFLTVGVAVGTRWYWFEHRALVDGGRKIRSVVVGSGLVYVHEGSLFPDMVQDSPPGWSIERSSGWHWGRSGEAGLWMAPLGWHHGVANFRRGYIRVVGTSLLYPVALTLIPAALLWYADRRRFGPHQCSRCGYDRGGLAADTKCPECGAVPST